ncbi:SpoIIE family protein phosphatase [Candidatus Venteria ishoeyi]|uniref:PP2C family protein-serine/threonine phosphatase n=1 Tax=Candidatus Venteria ishoeyi TaxID=1899563 RepID=UPI0025A662E3|nr:SpoIIE family protein phosphatase [Candidatus Venteria ishoeyi]MDM8546546.1 SpoIIE family protein phosphatase [Candidatus Venteria ishoeyi]
MKILIAEDSDSTRLFLKVLLKQYGYEVISARDGLQAWQLLQQHPDLALVLTDWLMPNMDGLALCKKIRAENTPHYIYIVVLTQKDQKSALIEGMEAGADDFLLKPVDKNELRVRLQAGQRVIDLERRLAERNQNLLDAQSQIHRSLKAAAQTQRRLLPAPKQIQDYQFDWRFYPSEFVAGDMLNFFSLTPRHIAFYQLDVSGHGVRSALLSFALYHRIINHQESPGLLLEYREEQWQPRPPADVVDDLNQLFQSKDNNEDLYFTLLYGVIDTQQNAIAFTQAGHPKPLHVTRQGEVQSCGQHGFPVGMLPEFHYNTQHLSLLPGERLIIYSDGVTECLNEAGEEFGTLHLSDYLKSSRKLDLSRLLDGLGAQLRSWRGSNNFDDDVTLLVLENSALIKT